MLLKPSLTSSSAFLYWQDGTKNWTCLQANCRHQAVDVRASPYSLLQTSCSMQWQEAVKVLVKPLSDSFQANVNLERFGYPSQFADFFSFSSKYCKRAITKQFDLCLQYYCRFVSVHCECHLFKMNFILKQTKQKKKKNSQKKFQVTVYTKSIGDIPLYQNSVHHGFALAGR